MNIISSIQYAKKDTLACFKKAMFACRNMDEF